MPGSRARQALGATRFADVRWVAETGSTNLDVLDLARAGAPEGVVLVADHQRAGRGRQGRSWSAPPGASLLVTVLLRPPAERAPLCTMALGIAAVEGIEAVAGFTPRLKWPNDLVWPGDASGADRKLAGILAEADWSSGEVVVAAGIGINVTWPATLPVELEAVAVACNHVTDRPVDREDLLVAWLQRLERWYGTLVADGPAPLLARWRATAATLGRRVRLELAAEQLEGTAIDITDAGHLVLGLDDGSRRTVAAGDVVHLRPAE